MATQSGGDKITRMIVIGMVIFVVAVGGVFSFLGNKSSTGGTATPATVSKSDGYGIVFNGDLKDKPVVDLWEDFQCPACGAFESVNGAYIEELITQKKAKVVFHILSFLGPESKLAANAAACSSEEGKFLQFHKYLYANQGAENSGRLSIAGLLEAGAAVGLTSSTFKDCVNAGTYNGWVDSVASDGASKSINATPTVFVNGKEIDRNTQYMNPVAFKSAVEG